MLSKNRVPGRRCVTCQFDYEPMWPDWAGCYDASPTSKQHWANVPCLLRKRRRHTGPDPVCVQEIGLHSLPRILFQYQTSPDHSYTGAFAGTSGGNLGTAQQILPLKKQRGHRSPKGEMPACPALLKPRSATRTRLKIVHCRLFENNNIFTCSLEIWNSWISFIWI